VWLTNSSQVILDDEGSYDPSSKSVARAGGEDLEVFLELGFRLRRRGFGREFSLLLEVKEKKGKLQMKRYI